MFKKTLFGALVLLVTGSVLHAQGASGVDPYDPSGRLSFSIQGGVIASLSENCFSYNDNGYFSKLFTPGIAAALTYDIDRTYAVRLSVGYGKNMSGANVKQTAVRNNNGFWPYGFKSINAFVDGIINFNGLNLVSRGFAPKIYAGLGYGHSFGFWRPEYSMMNDEDLLEYADKFEKYHPTQHINESNHTFGFRFGGMLEYDFKSGFGIYADLCGEAYLDTYNGLQPWEWDHAKGSGYAGFPVDLRGILSLGMLYRF